MLQDEQVERQVDYPTHLSGGFWTRAGRRILRSRENCWQLESATNFVYFSIWLRQQEQDIQGLTWL